MYASWLAVSGRRLSLPAFIPPSDPHPPFCALGTFSLRLCHAACPCSPLQVWDFNRSAEMRDTEGGTSTRSVLDQVDKMRAYLAAEEAQ